LRGRVTNKWLISAVRPLAPAANGFAGVIVAAVEPSYFDQLWGTVDLVVSDSVVMFRRDGVLMMRSPFDDAAMGKNYKSRPFFTEILPRAPSGVFQSSSPIDRVARIYAYRTLSAQPDLVVVVGQSIEVVLARWRQLATLAFAIWAAAAAAVMGLCAFLNQAWRQGIDAQVRVKQMAQRMALATEAAAIGVWDWDVKADQWYASPTYFTMLGYSPEEGFSNRGQWRERIHPDDRELVAQKVQEVLNQTTVAYGYEARLRHANGSFRWVHVIGRTLEQDANGKPSRLLGVRIDVTERKQNEAALLASEARYRELFESNPHPMWVFDLETLAFLAVNDAAVSHYGFTRSEFLGMTIHDIRPAEDVLLLQRQLTRGAHGLQEGGLWRHRRKDGSVILVEVTSHTLSYHSRPAKLVLAHDVTERHRAEEKLRLSEENLAITLQSIGDAVIATDTTGAITRMNATAERLTGWSFAKAKGQHLKEIFQIINAKTRLPATDPVQRVMQSGEIVEMDKHTTLLARDGREYHIADSGAPIRGPSGEITGVVLVFNDVTEEYRVRQNLATTVNLLERTGEIAKVGGWELDLRTMKIFWSLETFRIHDLEPPDVPALDQAINFYAPEAQPTIRAAVQAGIDHGTPWDLELPMVTAKGRHIWVRAQGFAVMEEGKVVQLHGSFHDVTQHRRDEEEIRRLAFFDPLTGLPNRRLLMDRLQQAMASSARSGLHGALMFLDLDHFKQLNDTLGHDVGDMLLQQVAARLQGCIRDSDSVARLGGDEFVVLLETLSAQGPEAAPQAEIIAHKILAALRQPYTLGSHVYDSTPSIGIVMFKGDQEILDNLLKKADLAMYQAKSAGRNTARFFDPAMQAAVAAHDALEKDLHRGLAQQEFELHYQVQVNGHGTPVGAEALVRWNHPERGVVLPAQFIAMAEEIGLILPLGQWVLETACNQLAAWSRVPETAAWTMAVNVSAAQLAQPGFVGNVAMALQKSGANPQHLKLELTESTLVDDVEGVIVKMNAVKAYGVNFSLDDFGTGYSSLSYLKRLPLDQLKIDQSFVHDVLIDPSDAMIARTIL
ncbi:MAG: hypothetical protein RLZZ401_1394, partial [Pseudomonadota bacterium]